MKKFCVALAISMIAYGNVEATDLKLGFSVTHIFNNNDPVLTPSDQRLAPEWTKEVEFTVNGSKYFVGVSNWMESESLALHSAKANALGAMAFAKQSTVS